jgi:hypothetical protein
LSSRRIVEAASAKENMEMVENIGERFFEFNFHNG